jgi:DNA-damage-inducible protein D
MYTPDFFGATDKNIRRVWHQNEWWFVTEDIVSTLIPPNTDSPINNIRFSNPGFNKWYLSNSRKLKIDHYNQKEPCINIEGFFRLVQSINTEKAEPFKLWLAKLGKTRIDELK